MDLLAFRADGELRRITPRRPLLAAQRRDRFTGDRTLDDFVLLDVVGEPFVIAVVNRGGALFQERVATRRGKRLKGPGIGHSLSVRARSRAQTSNSPQMFTLDIHPLAAMRPTHDQDLPMSTFIDPVPQDVADPTTDYPANAFAFRYMLPALLKEPGRRLLEVGVGQGAALSVFTDSGFEVSGFDIDHACVLQTQNQALALGLDAERFTHGDLREPASYRSICTQGRFDGIVAMGVLPHIADKGSSLQNLLDLTEPGGQVFIEFRNLLFAMSTFNRFTHSLFMDQLLHEVSGPVRDAVNHELASRLRMDVPGSIARSADAGDDILETFDNPLTVPALFADAGFDDIRVHYFHYHAGMPYLQSEDPVAFRRADVALEDDSSGWRGMFLASAFVIHARRPTTSSSDAR